MDDKRRDKWYFKTYSVIIAILLLGPFALPLVWKNPRYSKTAKIITTIIVIVLTYYLTVAFTKSLQFFNESYQQLLQSR